MKGLSPLMRDVPFRAPLCVVGGRVARGPGAAGEALAKTVYEARKEPPIEPARAGIFGREPHLPPDDGAVAVGREVDVGAVVLQREPGQQRVAEPPAGDGLDDQFTAGDRAGLEDTDGAGAFA